MRLLSLTLVAAALGLLRWNGDIRMPSSLYEWRILTCSMISFLVVTTIAYTAFARIFGGNEATISCTCFDICRAWPIVPFVAGMVAGHILWILR